tara:strand:+ start:594 stop:842 length:249 start_codon:yes stop_codon:yes gene_type:complete
MGRGISRGAGKVATAQRAVEMKRAVAKKAVVGKIPHAKIAVAVSKVGSAKLGHGGFCHANRIKNSVGSRNGGEGLRRVVHMK